MEHQLPFDIHAEKSLLSAMISSWEDKLMVSNILSSINSTYFYDSNNQFIFKAIWYLNSKSIEVDMITLSDQLKKFWVLDTIWWINYILEVIDFNSTAWNNYEQYIQILKDKYYLRTLKWIADIISTDVVKLKDPFEIIDTIQSKITWLVSTVWNTWTMHISQVLQTRYEELSELIENPDKLKDKVVYTWYLWLDNLLGWLHKWNLCLMAWRPWMWKTSIALNIANNVIKQDKCVVYFSMEMSESELVDRLISLYSWINWFKLRTWKINDKELLDINVAMDKLHKHKLLVDATPSLTPNLLKTKLNKINAETKIDLVIIDYLWLMKEPSEKNKVQEISEISRSLKLFAKEFNIPIIALSQLSRAVETRQDKRPIMSDLRDSWWLEQDADQIVFLYRDEVYDEFTQKPWILETVVRKNRHWSLWIIELWFDKVKQLITNKWKN